MTLPVDRHKDCIEVPLVTWLGASTLQLIGVVLSKLQTPLADGLMGHHDPTGEHHLFYVAVTQAEARIQPDARTDDLTWKAVIFVAVGGRGRGHVWLSIGGFGWL